MSLHTSSARRRQSNPRKAYPVDSGLILTATSTGLSQAPAEAPKGIDIRPAWEWMLESAAP